MGAVTKRRHHMRGKAPFGQENAELKNTPLKRRDGCSVSRCITDCNYTSLFYLAIRMRIIGSGTCCWTGSGGRERRETWISWEWSVSCTRWGRLNCRGGGVRHDVHFHVFTKPQPSKLSSDIQSEDFSTVSSSLLHRKQKNGTQHMAASNFKRRALICCVVDVHRLDLCSQDYQRRTCS